MWIYGIQIHHTEFKQESGYFFLDIRHEDGIMGEPG